MPYRGLSLFRGPRGTEFVGRGIELLTLPKGGGTEFLTPLMGGVLYVHPNQYNRHYTSKFIYFK